VCQEGAYSPIDPWVEEQVSAPGEFRLEAPGELVLASSPRLEAWHPPGDGLRHRVVEAHVEVEEGMLLEAAPVAAVHHPGPHQVEGARHQPAFLAGLHQLAGVAEGAEHP
jgi:hypothetical protein